jgi:2'-5' RNA ligase
LKFENNTCRIFFAVPASQEIIALQDSLRVKNAHLKKIKWMRNHNLHLTIYFIGNVLCEYREEIIQAVVPVIANQKAFTLTYESLFFAPSHKPRMLWVKYQKHEAFSVFAESVHYVLSKYVPNNKFFRKDPIPHITLARFHSMKNYSEIIFPPFNIPQTFTIHSCELWQTVKNDGKSDYQPVVKFYF